MQKTFTLEDLIRFAYNETQLLETVKIRHAIDEDEELCEQYVDLVSIMHRLDQLKLNPSEHCVDNILSYSRNHTASALI